MGSGVVLGEAPYFFWPQMFMMYLGLESRAAFLGCLLLGAAVIGIGAYFASKSRPFLNAGSALAAVYGLGCMVGALGLLLFVGWNIAEFFDWPTVP